MPLLWLESAACGMREPLIYCMPESWFQNKCRYSFIWRHWMSRAISTMIKVEGEIISRRP
ncbi:hypothetical protein BDW68DRAFT_161604 [Aspergillus falconensis]